MRTWSWRSHGVHAGASVAFRPALKAAWNSRDLCVIEVPLSPADLRPTWTRIAWEIRTRMRKSA